MAAQEVHQDDIGTIFRAIIKDDNVILDVSGATVQQLIFKKPSGATLTKTSVFTGTGSDGEIEYVSVLGDLNETGEWKIQAYLELPAGKWRTDIGCFTVYENL